MMRSRNIFLIIFIVLLGAGIIYLLKSDPMSTMKGGLTGILPEASDKVDRIELISSTDTLRLLGSGKNWSFEDGEILNADVIESLLFTASNLHLVSIVSSEEVKQQQAFTILRFYQGRKLSAQFRFLEFRNRSVVYREGDEAAYIVELPGYDERLIQKVFSLNPDHYRDHLLLNLLPSEITAVEITPLKGSSFSVSQDTAAQVVVRDIHMEEVDYSDRKIRLLLSYFSAIRFEEFLPAEQLPADFDPEKPSAMIRVTDFESVSHVFRIYRWTRSAGEEADLYKALVLYNDNPQVLIVNYTYLDLLIRGLEEYVDINS